MEKLLKSLLKNLKLNENTISTILGGIVVVVIGLLVFNYFKSINQGQITSTSTTNEAVPGQVELVEEAGKMVPKGLPTTYTVEKGDHLWKIAENFYQSGYNWVDIAAANQLKNGNYIEIGQKLTIPKAEVKLATVAAKPATIDTGSYTVVKGDYLWNIAVRAYGDGYAWTKIYSANIDVIGTNPNLIEVGMNLTLPR